MLKPTVEHILSKSLGGSDNTQNLVLACEQCNSEMGNLPVNVKINRAVRYRVELIINLSVSTTVSFSFAEGRGEVG